MSAVSALRAAKATGSRLVLVCGVVMTLIALAALGLRASAAEAADIPRFSAPLVTIQFGGSELGSLVAADFNGDGRSDVAIPGTSAVDVQLGKGDGSFRNPADYRAGADDVTDLVPADLNGDGMPDLVALTDRISVLLND